MHKTEIQRSIQDIEVQLEGKGPWNLLGDKVSGNELEGGMLIVHTPGHTTGSICLWHETTKTMFTGDHLGYSEEGRATIFPRYNQFDLKTQLESVRKLLDFDFQHILPGHGRRFHVDGAEEREQIVAGVLAAELLA
jgi:glyoxylase-like metal-dependent hydrolase (beta-lactamase superfamily II)